ncbi:hypothetical protein EHS25_006889 [Saitozyma podzolica]|uniref:CMP/dCMP-type deaminase domain-containing protein n=1 Tax=Saitozyma podzolica TaxID=1890683 RepID=A0A427XRD0_9TREE|nr:hypothetical protein EHS25_006889 [Saitozyma podzolica]
MANIVHSVGGLVEAGVKGLMGFAEGYMSGDDGPAATASASMSGSASASASSSADHAEHTGPDLPTFPGALVDRDGAGSSPESHAALPVTITPRASNAGANAGGTSTHSSSSSKPSLPPQASLVQTFDVPSGWIHLQSTYLDKAGGQRKIRSFGLRNLVHRAVDVEVESDLSGMLLLWLGDDDRASPSSSSSSSSFSNAGSHSLSLTLPPLASTTVFLAFTPSSRPATPATQSPSVSDGGFTPRVLPVLSSAQSSDVPRSAPLRLRSSSRRPEPLHRSFPIHGSITIRATSDSPDPLGAPASQSISLPFFATVCRSMFTAALIDPVSGLVTGAQISSGQLTVDFGSDPVVGQEYHRDILLVNRSEIELVWNTAVVSARHKDAVWFSLRDLDSENVFGVDGSAQPVPLPALSSRHLRLELRVKEPVTDFDFDFIISNAHQSGNVVTCRAIGSGQAEAADTALKILSGMQLDFGQIHDGVWARKLVTCKNTGDKPLDVRFSATEGHDVVFRLAGVAGDDMDEDVPPKPDLSLSRVSTRDPRDPPRGRDWSTRSRGGSPASSIRSGHFDHSPHMPGHLDLSQRLDEAWSLSERSERSSGIPSHGREPSLPPSRPLSRVASRASSHRWHTDATESDDDEPEMPLPFFSAGDGLSTSPHEHLDRAATIEVGDDKAMPNLIEELTMRPGTEYRVFVLYRPARNTTDPPAIAGALRESSFKVFLDASSRGRRTRRTLHCTAESCTSLIQIASGNRYDFGEVTVGASKSTTLAITNLSALSARVEIAAISKVLSTNRNVIVIPPHETVEEKLEFFPRRINDRYEKQIFVRNLLNRPNDQLVEIRSRNVDVNNVTLHSHLYRILTPSGSNFLDFGLVVINSPTVRTVQFENLTPAQLVLSLDASQPEDVELFVKAEDAMPATGTVSKYASPQERITSPQQNGDLKERFMESLREIEAREPAKPHKPKTKAKEKVGGKKDGEAPKVSVAAAVASALKKGGRGRPVQLYGNSVVFKDRSLLDSHEFLDLAAGPPVASHRTSPRSKKTALLDSIEQEDRSKLSGQHPKIPKLDFAASAKATGLHAKDTKPKKSSNLSQSPPQPETTSAPSLSQVIASIKGKMAPPEAGTKSPALTGKRIEPKVEMFTAADISKMSVDELLVAVEQHDAKRSSMTHTSLEEEEGYVRRTISLRKELQNLVSAGKLVPARNLSVPPRSTRQLIVVVTPNGSTRPHISTRPKGANSRIFIHLVDFDRSFLSTAPGARSDLAELPVRELIMRSSAVRSVLEVQQSSINFGNCEKGEVKSKTIVIQNKSDCIGLFRLRTSGSIASGDLKLGLGRYGVISAFGRKEVGNFSFTPSLVGNYNETMVVENVLDSFNDQNVSVKATVRKQPTFSVEPATTLDFGTVDTAASDKIAPMSFILTNVSKGDKTFVVQVAPREGAFADVSLSRDESDAGTALSKAEEEEAEGLLQKLKIARRKGKADKISKYEARLSELGVTSTSGQDDEASEASDEKEPEKQDGAADGEDVEGKLDRIPLDKDKDDSGRLGAMPSTIPSGVPKPCNHTLSITLQPNQKTKVLVELVSRSCGGSGVAGGPLATTIRVHEKKNTDETAGLVVTASPMSAGSVSVAHREEPNSSSDPLHLALMRHCLQLTLLCPVSQTAFCVGSTLFLPSSSAAYESLRPHFPAFNTPTHSSSDPSISAAGAGTGGDSTTNIAGLILGDGYSRQIPGNTHAEANALTNFRTAYAALLRDAPQGSLPAVDEVLAEVDCYATMEPCSVRTSGGPSCALELVRARVKTVYLGVEEPPDFVQCEGVRILEDGGVVVSRVSGLEEECLKAARRGRA